MQKGVNSRYRSALKNDAVCLIKRDTAGAVKTNAVVRQKLTLLSVGRPPHRHSRGGGKFAIQLSFSWQMWLCQDLNFPKNLHSNTGMGDYFPKKVISS